jgi:hypothetical protein
LFADLRHMFIADVYTYLADKFKSFQEKNKAARLGMSVRWWLCVWGGGA